MSTSVRKRPRAGNEEIPRKWLDSQTDWASRQPPGAFDDDKSRFFAWLDSLPDGEQAEFWGEMRDRSARKALSEWEQNNCPGPSETTGADAKMLATEYLRRNNIRHGLGVPANLDIRRLREAFETELADQADWSRRRGKQFAKVLKTARKLEQEISALQSMESQRPQNRPTFVASLLPAPPPERLSFEGKRFRTAAFLVAHVREHLEPLFAAVRRKRGRQKTFVSFLEAKLKAEGLTDGRIAKVLKLEGLGEVTREQIRDRRRKARRKQVGGSK